MRRRLAIAAVGLAACVMIAASGGAGATGIATAAGCSHLAVSVSLPSMYAASYPSSVSVQVTTNGGPIRNVRAAIYTFSGDQIAAGHRAAALTSSATIKLKLSYGALQVGSYTLVVSGTPASSPACGLEKFTKVEAFKDCVTTLPLTFVDPPGGMAAAYGGYLSVPLKSNGPLIRELEGAVYAADGTLFGDGTLSGLYGQATLNLKLNQGLVPGEYTVVVAGLISQPTACGPKTAQITLDFS
ncbi:MAG TPA: hypothetical protein VG165_03445 [Solirubrobacteraceae bacterium]|jgi:hypothetical protein|nr:hypothetical protein [Solirubrobacteraceae bacterium]